MRLRSRSDWYASYVDQVARRDVRAILSRSDPDRVRRYLEACALNSAGAASHATIFTAAGVNRKTAARRNECVPD
jgi:predicted AAA+ superfamily ATPase